MTNEEAIKFLQGHIDLIGEDATIEPLLAISIEADKAAISALREAAERENPQPLTLDELRKQDGRWIWIEHMESSCSLKKPGEWLKLKSCNPNREHPYVDFEGKAMCAIYYGKGWIAYDFEVKTNER
jgi:hypothetical protein